MADTVAAAIALDATIPLTIREALSGVFGYISIVCWTCVLFPQLIVNYRNQSSDGVSIPWLSVWLIGNICNFIGGLWAGVVRVIVAVSAYFCLINGALIIQCVYYRLKKSRQSKFTEHTSESVQRTSTDSDLDDAPLVQCDVGPPTADAVKSPFITYVVPVVAVIVIGSGAWALSYYVGAWRPSATSVDDKQDEKAMVAQLLGWISCILCLSARVLQILKNMKAKSCEGLSVLLFIIALLGNVTYTLGILCHSTQREYLLRTMPWYATSIGGVMLDSVIFIQFYTYGSQTGYQQL